MQRLFDGLEPFEIEMLFALEFIGAMRIADGDGQRIHARCRTKCTASSGCV